MKNKLLYILFAAGLLVALTACEPKYDYRWTSYVVMDDTSLSIAEDDTLTNGVLTLGVTAYVQKGAPVTEVSFRVIDGDGDNGAKQGEDFYLLDHQSGMLYFDGDSTTLHISFQISDKDVGIYTGRKTFYVELTEAGNGYELGGAYKTTVTITDADRNLEATGIVGTYMAEGLAYPCTAVSTWELTVHQDETNPELYWVDGLTPTDEGNYPYGTEYCAYGYYGDATEQTFVIPSQVSDWYESSYQCYLGWTPCTAYDPNEGWSYNRNFPDLTFTMIDADTWESDYGVFLGAFLTKDVSTSSFDGFFDVVAPTLKIYRID